LYQYDALGRLQEANIRQATAEPGIHLAALDIGRFIRLGSLGTALLPQVQPRVLLIDELDKSDVDLPNDLLHVFENGQFMISELARLPEDQAMASVFTADGDRRAPVHGGRVACRAFPIVVITSNAEREFPAAFQRRCIRLNVLPPDRDRIAEIVAAQMGPSAVEQAVPLIARFLKQRETGDISTDQLLNAIYFATSGARVPEESLRRLERALLSPLGVPGVL